MNARIATVFCVIGLGILIFFLPVQGSAAQGTLSLEFYGDPACPHCTEKEPIVQDFVAHHLEVSAIFVHKNYLTNLTNWQELEDYFASYGVSIIGVPILLLNNSGIIQVLQGGQITYQALDAWLMGALETDITLWGSFLLGLAFGGSSCLLLIMSLLGTTLMSITERKKYLVISVGLILGLLAAYTAISLIFYATFEIFAVFTNYIVYVFDAILITIGVWQIIEAKKEKSIIFGTPTRVKSWLKTFIEQQSGISSFLVGVLFALVKIPCIGGVFLQILLNTSQNPYMIYYVLLYYAGMILPVVLLLIGFRMGMQSEKVNKFREKYRAYLRLASGVLLVALTTYLLIMNILTSLQI